MYCLLNKDELIAKFDVDPLLDSVIDVTQFRQLPEMFGDIRVFIKNRRAPKHRENIKKLLKVSGCDTLQGFLDVSHALSLVDTFWVKPEGSNLEWKDVSLYTHPFDEAIAKAALDGELPDRGFSTTSPEYGTDGSFAKCWVMLVWNRILNIIHHKLQNALPTIMWIMDCGVRVVESALYVIFSPLKIMDLFHTQQWILAILGLI